MSDSEEEEAEVEEAAAAEEEVGMSRGGLSRSTVNTLCISPFTQLMPCMTTAMWKSVGKSVNGVHKPSRVSAAVVCKVDVAPAAVAIQCAAALEAETAEGGEK